MHCGYCEYIRTCSQSFEARCGGYFRNRSILGFDTVDTPCIPKYLQGSVLRVLAVTRPLVLRVLAVPKYSECTHTQYTWSMKYVSTICAPFRSNFPFVWRKWSWRNTLLGGGQLEYCTFEYFRSIYWEYSQHMRVQYSGSFDHCKYFGSLCCGYCLYSRSVRHILPVPCSVEAFSIGDIYAQYSQYLGRQYCNTLCTRTAKYTRPSEYTRSMKHTRSICAMF